MAAKTRLAGRPSSHIYSHMPLSFQHSCCTAHHVSSPEEDKKIIFVASKGWVCVRVVRVELGTWIASRTHRLLLLCTNCIASHNCVLLHPTSFSLVLLGVFFISISNNYNVPVYMLYPKERLMSPTLI